MAGWGRDLRLCSRDRGTPVFFGWLTYRWGSRRLVRVLGKTSLPQVWDTTTWSYDWASRESQGSKGDTGGDDGGEPCVDWQEASLFRDPLLPGILLSLKLGSGQTLCCPCFRRVVFSMVCCMNSWFSNFYNFFRFIKLEPYSSQIVKTLLLPQFWSDFNQTLWGLLRVPPGFLLRPFRLSLLHRACQWGRQVFLWWLQIERWKVCSYFQHFNHNKNIHLEVFLNWNSQSSRQQLSNKLDALLIITYGKQCNSFLSKTNIYYDPTSNREAPGRYSCT